MAVVFTLSFFICIVPFLSHRHNANLHFLLNQFLRTWLQLFSYKHSHTSFTIGCTDLAYFLGAYDLVTFLGSIYLTLSIAIERYTTVCHPFFKVSCLSIFFFYSHC
jgi:hypothetical protein